VSITIAPLDNTLRTATSTSTRIGPRSRLPTNARTVRVSLIVLKVRPAV